MRVPVKYRWYERLFYRLLRREKYGVWLVFILISLLMLVQVLLLDPAIRRHLVLTDQLEGSAVRVYHAGR